MITFSDAVVAIAITLLAIDLPLPSGSTAHLFWRSVGHNADSYRAFLISFGAIAAVWSHHHDVFRYVRAFDVRLRTMNMCWLLLIVLTPFATRLLTAHGDHALTVNAVRYGFYALVQALLSGLTLTMVHYMVGRDLLDPDAPPLATAERDSHSLGLIGGFALSIPFFFVTSYAWVLWFAVPIVSGWLRGRYRRPRGRPGAGDGGPAEETSPEAA